MVEHICPNCQKIFNKKSTYNYHVNISNKCKGKSKIKIKIDNKPITVLNKNQKQCEYCYNIISSNKLNKHKLFHCSKIPKKDKKNLIKIYNNRKNTKNKIETKELTRTEIINKNKLNISENIHFQKINNIGFETIEYSKISKYDFNKLIKTIQSVRFYSLDTIYDIVYNTFKILNKFIENKNGMIKNISYLTIYGKMNNKLKLETMNLFIDNKITSSVNYISIFIEEHSDIIKNNNPLLSIGDLYDMLNLIASFKCNKVRDAKLKNFIKEYYINNNEQLKNIFKTKLGVI
jgi:uncharacterized C2H2 Zn-finger protein